ncbi:MAG: hypothetical protein MO852_13540, partial [Candidatus Devosia euplotis]|nr:hypothetical protein [Candidatus Devosia euplotis]
SCPDPGPGTARGSPHHRRFLCRRNQSLATPVLTNLPQPCPYPIAVGAIAASHTISLEAVLLDYLTASMHSQVSVAVRLVPIGQSDGLTIMAALEPVIASMTALRQHAARDDIGAAAYAADIAQMSHETLTTRIFRS